MAKENEEILEENKEQDTLNSQVAILKKKVRMTSLITIIVCAVIVIACFAFMAFKMGWIEEWFPSKAKMTMDDYSVIEIDVTYSSISSEEVQEYIDNILASYDTSEDLENGNIIENGDTINMDYVGVYADGENAGDPLDAGSAEDVSYVVGSGTILFDEDLIGLEVGSTNDISITFPDDYSVESLQSVNAVFTVTINSASHTVKQEYTDEWCEAYSETYLPEVLSTTDEFSQYVADYVFEDNLHTAMLSYLYGLANIKSYDKEAMDFLTEYYAEQTEYYAVYYYGVDADTLALNYGFSSADEYNTYCAETCLDQIMVIDYLCDELGIEGTEEGFDEAIEINMKAYGYSDSYTVDEYKEACGEAWLYMFDALSYRFDLVMNELEDRVVFVESETEESTEEAE